MFLRGSCLVAIPATATVVIAVAPTIVMAATTAVVVTVAVAIATAVTATIVATAVACGHSSTFIKTKNNVQVLEKQEARCTENAGIGGHESCSLFFTVTVSAAAAATFLRCAALEASGLGGKDVGLVSKARDPIDIREKEVVNIHSCLSFPLLWANMNAEVRL